MPIDPKIFELLRHHNPEERKKGVKALARTEDREALRYLATLYNTELDPEIRDLALKAGQHIKKRLELAKWGDDQGQAGGKFVDVEVKRDAPKQKSKLPTDAKTTQAKAMLDKAMDFVMQADYARAQDTAYQAFEIAPHIGDDPYYASVVAEVMGMPEKEAIAALKEGQPDYEVGKGKVKGDKKSKKAKRAPLGGKAFLLDTVIIAGVTLAAEIMLRGYLQLPLGPLDVLTGVGSTMIAIWVQFIMIHLAATTRLDGDGSFIDLFRDARLPVILQSFLYVMAFSYLTNEAPQILTDPAAMESSMNTVWTFLAIFAAGYFGYGIWLSIVIGKTYGFNPFKGFLAIIIGNSLTWCFYTMLQWAIAAIFIV